MHALRRKIEMIGDELGIGGMMPLPGRLRADQQSDAPVRLEPEPRVLRPVAAARFDVGGKADAAQLAGFFRARQTLVEALPVGDGLGLRHMARELSGVVALR